MDRSLIRTQDGSHTMLVSGLGEHYHSIYGAITESRHVFIENGFRQIEGDLTIFEAGFGTGLNALLTLLEAGNSNRSVFYETWEKDPLTLEEAGLLNYPEILAIDRSLFMELHQVPWNFTVPVNNNFTLLKVQSDLLDFNSKNRFNLVYFDAFGPDFQPDLWEYPVFQRLYDHMASESVLVTYSAKGQVRRNLVQAGFLVQKKPGPPGKREMIKAIKTK